MSLFRRFSCHPAVIRAAKAFHFRPILGKWYYHYAPANGTFRADVGKVSGQSRVRKREVLRLLDAVWGAGKEQRNLELKFIPTGTTPLMV